MISLQAGVLIAIDDVGLCRLAVRGRKENLFHDILDLFDVYDPVVKDLLRQIQDPDGEHFCSREIELARRRPCLGNGIGNLVRVEFNQTAIPLFDLCMHEELLFLDLFMNYLTNAIYWGWAY